MAGTVWWVLGSALHKGIELTIADDLSYQDGLDECFLEMKMLLHANRKVGTIESSSARRKRSLDTIEEDITRMYTTWWNAVHPDGSERLHWYDDYDWPPRVEYMIDVPDEVKRSGAALFTEVDAIFEGGPEDRPIAIVDWKTGSSKTADHAQLQIYRYGLHMEDRDQENVELWFPHKPGSMVGWFHHLDANRIQIVDPYLGNTVVQHWLTMTSAYKKAMIEKNTVVATNSFLCQNYNNAQALCPTCAPEPTEVKEWHEILGRMERAKVQKVPTGLLSSEDSYGKDDDG